ncbi:DUF4232 domain-containing protein [Frondihabitans cladoniiphilus]|uniref:DUF4232 domain-containing protein n=1 Tax=Frondihabitans cladoniiphilus TaxID=715785 RepID=UPI0031EF293A
MAWFLAGLAALGVSARSERLAPITDLLLIPTVPVNTWLRHGPWNLILPALAAVLFGTLLACGYAIAARNTRWDVAGRLLRAAVGWLIGVLAGALTAAVWLLAASLADREPTGLQWAFREDLPATLAAGLFGVVWGWLPALVHGWPAARAGRPATVVTVAVSLVVAVLASAGLVNGLSASTRQDRIAAGGTLNGLPNSTPIPTPTPTPPPRIAPHPVMPGADWCADADVSITASGVQGALGNRAMTLVLTNRGAKPCVVDGYPDVAFAGTDSGAVAATITDGSSYVAHDPGAKPITIAPGSTADSVLGWGAGAPGATAVTVLVAPYAGAVRSPLNVTTGITDQNTVDVTAWATPTPNDN